MPPTTRALAVLHKELIACERCPRLRTWCQTVAREKKAAYRDWDYWGLPVPGFGDPDARILFAGLAPAAHGANRTGRIFTGDRSGDFLYAALHRAGLANQPTAVSRDDGLRLRDVYILSAVRCAPPANKPALDELANCADWLRRELALLKKIRVAITLGKIGHDALLRAFKTMGLLDPTFRAKFAHGAVYRLPGNLPAIVCSYHVSQQNTFTGTLTTQMLDEVIATARRLADAAG